MVHSFQINIFANERNINISEKCTRQKSCFSQHLKAVANSHYITALIREFNHIFHYRRKARDCTATQIIAMSKSARKNYAIGILRQRSFLMPDVFGFAAEI